MFGVVLVFAAIFWINTLSNLCGNNASDLVFLCAFFRLLVFFLDFSKLFY